MPPHRHKMQICPFNAQPQHAKVLIVPSWLRSGEMLPALNQRAWPSSRPGHLSWPSSLPQPSQ
eukprot:1340158-Prorocentrum_lima.AAC.1